jgi:hypothetical protein
MVPFAALRVTMMLKRVSYSTTTRPVMNGWGSQW